MIPATNDLSLCRTNCSLLPGELSRSDHSMGILSLAKRLLLSTVVVLYEYIYRKVEETHDRCYNMDEHLGVPLNRAELNS
uniref:Uncharacterized protein n=1 Tax=Oryza punctata TaxID=4537 RepID=A0A0E0KD19_ORYPU